MVGECVSQTRPDCVGDELRCGGIGALLSELGVGLPWSFHRHHEESRDVTISGCADHQ